MGTVTTKIIDQRNETGRATATVIAGLIGIIEDGAETPEIGVVKGTTGAGEMTPASESDGTETILLTPGGNSEETAEIGPQTGTPLLDHERSVLDTSKRTKYTSVLTIHHRPPKLPLPHQRSKQTRRKKRSDSQNWRHGNKSKQRNGSASNENLLLRVALAPS